MQSSANADAVMARLALLGIDVKVDGPLNTNGVETNERDVA
jgi:cell division protein FtsN